MNERSVWKMTVAAVAVAGAFALAPLAASAQAPESSDPIKLVLLDWTGNHLSNHIAGEILTRMGYTVEYVTTAQAPAWQGLGDGSLHVQMEQWLVTQRVAYDELAAQGKIEDFGLVGLVGREAWYYPTYMEEVCPGLPAVTALAACTALLETAETAPKGRLVDFPEEWTPESPQWIEAFGLDLVAIPAGGEGSIVAEIRSAYAREEPLLVMFYEPHWVFGEFDMKAVDLPAWDAACETDPAWGPVADKVMDCYQAAPTILKVVWSGFEEKWPAAAGLVRAFTMTNAEQAPLVKRVDIDGESVEDVAKSWVDANEATWRGWIGGTAD